MSSDAPTKEKPPMNVRRFHSANTSNRLTGLKKRMDEEDAAAYGVAGGDHRELAS